MNPLRSVGGKLALALLLVVTGALTIVYLIVVPSYRQSLVNARLDSLQSSLLTLAQNPPTSYGWQLWATDAAPVVNSRVVLFDYSDAAPGGSLLNVADTSGLDSSDVSQDPIALRAGRELTLARGTVTRGKQEYAEVAYPLGGSAVSPVVLLSSPLHDELETVSVVRRRVFFAGGLAIAFSMVIGYLLAQVLTRRIARLESAAEQIAGGRFDEAVVDAGTDEIGQLARAFERMRLRLAHLDRARGEFIANASHELRTPLFSLGGFLELLDDEEIDAETRAEFLASMREQVGRLTKLATDLLDLSRMDAGRLGVAVETLDLADLAVEVAAEFQPRAAASGHAIEVAAGAPVAACGDAERVLQIGRILVENALRHTPAGTTVRVAAAADGRRATLTVADDGPGIPQEARNQVFERFYRLDGSMSSGSGLGLAIARELAELMGGRIELDAEDGWTIFTLALAADVVDRERDALLA